VNIDWMNSMTYFSFNLKVKKTRSIAVIYLFLYCYFHSKKEDPLQQGYSRVSTNPDSGGGTLSNSTTSTSLDTVVIDTSTDNISSSPKLQKQKQRTFSPILESEDASSNPFADDIKELAIRTKQGIKFDEEEEGDRFDEEEAFRKKREHFQKTKSRSEHKSILIRVNLIF